MKKFITILTTIIVICAVTFITISKKSTTKIDEQISVTVCTPDVQNITPSIQTFGTVLYKTKNDITTLQNGTVIEKYIKEGDFVNKNDVLYKLKNVELEIQQSQCINNLNSAKANLHLLQIRHHENEQMIQSHILSLKNKQIEIDKTNKSILLATEKLNIKLELNKLGGISDQEIKDLQNEIDFLKLNLDIQKRELESESLGFTKNDLLKNGITPKDNTLEFEKQLIELNTRSSLADIQVAKATFENAQKSLLLINSLLENLTIKSPVTGIVGATYFEKGEHITENEKIVTVMDTSTCVALINVQENCITNIEQGSKALVEIPSVNKSVDSEISEISPAADSSTGNFFIKVNFSNNDFLVKPGMFVKCTLEQNNLDTFICIPETALIKTNDNIAECFSVKNNLAIIRKIELHSIKNGIAFIKSGLSENEKIIDSPSAKIKEGTRVKIL